MSYLTIWFWNDIFFVRFTQKGQIMSIQSMISALWLHRHHSSVNCSPTYKQLAVELQMNVSVSGGFLNGAGMMVHIQRGLLHVPLGSHVMPALVVQSRRRLHLHLQRSVPHVKREEHLSRGCKHKHIWWMFRLISGWWLILKRNQTWDAFQCNLLCGRWCLMLWENARRTSKTTSNDDEMNEKTADRCIQLL